MVKKVLIAALRGENDNYVPNMEDWKVLLGPEFIKFKIAINKLKRSSGLDKDDILELLKYELFDHIVEYAQANPEEDDEDDTVFFEGIQNVAQNMFEDLNMRQLIGKRDEVEDISEKRVKPLDIKGCNFEQSVVLGVIYDKHMNALRAKAEEYAIDRDTLIRRLMKYLKKRCRDHDFPKLTVAVINEIVHEFLIEADYHLGGHESFVVDFQKQDED